MHKLWLEVDMQFTWFDRLKILLGMRVSYRIDFETQHYAGELFRRAERITIGD